MTTIRRSLALILVLALAAVPALAQQAGARVGGGAIADLETELPLPGVSGGELPSQERFASWPSPQLVQRPYYLPWGQPAFDRASLFARPVLFLLTVGWNRTVRDWLAGTASDPVVAGTINAGYISVLVSADRRPDIKERYQTGAWPVVAFLLPNGQPMLSQANEQGMPRPITASDVDAATFRFLLEEGVEYWSRWRDVLFEAAAAWTLHESETGVIGGPIDELAADTVAEWMLGNADRVNGWFGMAPKFLVPGLGAFASMRAARLRPDLVEHSRLSLQKLLASPLYDADGGGMHRIATAPEWRGVHTEKMLAGNAGLLLELQLALRTGQGDPETLQAALRGTSSFISGVLARPEGGFYLAQVAQPLDGENTAQAEVDRLVLSGPNALAGAALLRAGNLLGDDTVSESGRRALEMVYATAYSAGRGVSHVIDPQPNHRIFLVAQADVATGFIDAYESLGDPRFLDAARDIVDASLRNLRGSDERALRDYLAEAQPYGLLANPRWPLRSNARLARVMIRLSHQGAGEQYREQAREILSYYTGDLGIYGVQGLEAGLAVEEWLREPLLIRIRGRSGDDKVEALRTAALRSPWAWTVVQTDQEASSPAAELDWRGKTRRIKNPAELHEAIVELTGLETP